MNTMVKAGGNPLTALATGLTTGTYAALGHGAQKLGMDLPGSRFYKEALKYAEDNGVINKSALDEANIGDRGIIHTAANTLGMTISAPEVFTRSVAYMTFVDMLKQTKKFSDTEVFQKAEELTNASMVDYRKNEKPLMFSKLGVAGDALNTLQTYPMNLYNQYRYFGKEAMKGNVLPLASMLLLQGALAGAAGIPGFNDIDKLWGWVKEALPLEAWEKVKDFDPKLWMMENLGEAATYGALSSESGVGLTSRVSAPSAGDMIQAPGGPISDLAKQVGSVGKAILDPTNNTKRAQAIRDVAPSGLQGWLETGPLKDEFSIPRQDGTTLYKKPSDLADRKGQYARTPFEEKLRASGLRSQKEVVTNDVLYKTQAMGKETEKRSKDMVENFYDAVRRGDSEKASELQKLYSQINGKGIEDRSLETQVLEEYTTALEKQTISAKEKLEAVKGLARARKILNDNKTTTP